VADGIRYHSELAGIDWTEVDQLFRAAGLGGRDPKIFPNACRQSHTCVFAELDGHTIGMGRLLSDGFFGSAIFDVAVLPQHQCRGIGRKIMGLLHEKLPKMQCLIYAVPGKEGFYERLGYHRCKTGMLLTSDPAKLREAGYI
jgi:aralkylamine N-acetyltransferase